MSEKIAAVIKMLEDIVAGDIPVPHFGLCAHIIAVLNKFDCRTFGVSYDELDKITALAKSWPEYSGNSVFPVPSFDLGMKPGEYFVWHQNKTPNGNLYVGEYGAARIRLAQHLIEQLKLQQEATT